MLAIMTTQNAIASIKDNAIKSHMQNALDAALDVDKSTLKIAYHATAIKPLLEGNTDGLPTKYAEFASKCFGVKKAQAYNLLAIGGNVACVTSIDGKKNVYIDEFTLENISEKHNPDTNWDEYFAAVKKARSLGATQILTICKLQLKLDFECSDICAMLEEGSLSADMTIKEFEKAIRGKFTALDTKEDDTKSDDTKADDTKSDDTKSDDAKADDTKADAKTETISLPVDIVKNAYPIIARYAEESQEMAALLHYLNGIKDVIQ